MTERKMITVNLDAPEAADLSSFIDDLITVRDSVPAEYRNAIDIDLYGEEGYSVSIEIEYRRLENDEEYEVRKKRDHDYLIKLRTQEIAELERLQKKYSNNG